MSMKATFSIFFSFIILVITTQNALFLVDYQINKGFYEEHCENKDKPEMQCHGKCQVKKEASSENNPINEIKFAFEFNILPSKPIVISVEKPTFIISKEKIVSQNNTLILKGFLNVIPHPPQNLV